VSPLILQRFRELTRCGNRSLIDSLGLTTRLRDYNISKEDIPQIVEKTIGKSSGELYDQVTEVMEKAF
jgi:alcohol dehydrogenase YqhD (iron-dependent ADH family)